MNDIASQCEQGNFKEFTSINCAKVKLNIKIKSESSHVLVS